MEHDLGLRMWDVGFMGGNTMDFEVRKLVFKSELCYFLSGVV